MNTTINTDRLACRNCTKLKVKCDKQEPCSRCTRTGHECLPRDKPARRQRRSMPYQARLDIGDNDSTSTRTLTPQRPTAAPSVRGKAGIPEAVWTLLNDIAVEELLVKFHLKYLAWHHNCLHSPTFLEECEAYWSGHELEQSVWMALYLSVLSTSAWTIENTPWTGELLRLETSVITGMARHYYQAMVDVLYAIDFTTNHSIYSIQSVLVSTMVAHNLGRQEQLYTLMFSSIKIAQCLGLHRIKTTEKFASMCHAEWSETVNNEVRKRIYWKLVESDFYAIPYTNTYGININHVSTPMPLNCDDHDLEEQDSSVLTISTYTNVMIRMSLLMPQLLDLLQSAATSSIFEQFEHVVEIDRRMRLFVSTIPQILLRQGSEETPQPVWLETARRSIALAAADKIIMIHRSFLMRSFETPLLMYTRTTCVSAAITILRELEVMDEREHIPLWTHAAYSINAAIILCLQIQHSPRHDENRERYRRMILTAQARLQRMKSDEMSIRGSRIIHSLLAREDLRHRSDGQAYSALSGGAQSPSSPSFSIFGGLPALEDVLATSRPSTTGQRHIQLGSFEDWFTQAFGLTGRI